MKLDLIKQPAAVTVKLLDTSAEHPVECDILLPDYCPDIVRVLTCRADTDVTDRTVNGSTLTVEGMTTVTLCYLGEVGGVRKATVRQPFSKSFELTTAPVAPVVFVSAQRSALGCRAVSRRRADVRGSLQITALVYDSFTREVVSGSKCESLCLLTEEREHECITQNASSRFSLREEVSPNPGVGAVSNIVRSECAPVVTEWRPVSGGVLIKGELLISMLVSDSEGKLSLMRYSLPVSRLIDSKNPEMVKSVSIRCASIECQPPEGEDGRISVEMQFEASMLHSQRQTLTAARDAFSTRCEHQQTEETLSCLSVHTDVREKVTAGARAPIPDGAGEICDVCASVSQLSCTVDEGELRITGRVNFAALLSGGEGAVQAVSASSLFEKTVASPGEGSYNCQIRACVTSADAAATEDGVSFDAEILVTGVLLENSEWCALSDITVDENSPRERDPAVGLVVRYADTGERVWDIASHYGIEPGRIMSDNALEEDVIQSPTVLIISAPQS